MKQTPILLHSKARSALYPKNVPHTFMLRTTTDNYKYSRANVMSDLKTGLVQRKDNHPSGEWGVVRGVREVSLMVNWPHWTGQFRAESQPKLLGKETKT